MDRILWIGFLNDLFCGRSYIAAPAELSIPVLIHCCIGRLGRRAVGGVQEVSYGDARANSERAAPLACVGRRLSAPQIVWNSSPRRAGALGGPRVGRNHKNGNSVTVARNRTQRPAMTMPAPYATRGVSGALFIL